MTCPTCESLRARAEAAEERAKSYADTRSVALQTQQRLHRRCQAAESAAANRHGQFPWMWEWIGLFAYYQRDRVA